MNVELNVKQKNFGISVMLGVYTKNKHPDATVELARSIRSSWLSEDDLLDQVKRGCDLVTGVCIGDRLTIPTSNMFLSIDFEIASVRQVGGDR